MNVDELLEDLYTAYNDGENGGAEVEVRMKGSDTPLPYEIKSVVVDDGHIYLEIV